jgi:hypothetical protein
MNYIEKLSKWEVGQTYHHVAWLVMCPGLPKGVSERRAEGACATCAAPGIMARALSMRMWMSMGVCARGHGRFFRVS